MNQSLPTEVGTVARVVVDRGFGFIRVEGMPDLFFHVKDMDRELEFDERLIERRVRFTVEASPRGLQAIGVRPAF